MKASKKNIAPVATVQKNTRASSHALKVAMLKAKQQFSDSLEQGEKSAIRDAHLYAKKLSDAKLYKSFKQLLNKYKSYLPIAGEIIPEKISPILYEITSDDKFGSDLFRLLRAGWSMPYNKGYGRRLRYLIMDQYHNKVIGIIGLQSPPADLSCRDKIVGKTDDKLAWVNSTMDAYTVGAISPYRELLGGKLVAGFLAAEEIQVAYWRKYAGSRSLMKKKLLKQPLIGITTASAFGRSSIYNRLKFNDRLLLQPIGHTMGYGSIHIEQLYPRIADWLKKDDSFVSAGYGNGPKVRWQNIQIASAKLGLGNNFLSHGLKREVFLSTHVENFAAVARGDELAISNTIASESWSHYWKDRYCLPRASRNEAYKHSDGYQDLSASIEKLA